MRRFFHDPHDLLPWKPPPFPAKRSCPASLSAGCGDGLELTTVTVQNEEGARAIGKPPGRYITLETDPIGETALTGTAEAALLGESLSSLLPSDGTLLVACLGNAAITPDALGPRSARWVLATRHVAGREQLFQQFRPVVVLAPGVLGQTGIETAG